MMQTQLEPGTPVYASLHIGLHVELETMSLLLTLSNKRDLDLALACTSWSAMRFCGM